MSISITINDIDNLTDTERAVLRLVADNSVATSLKAAVQRLTPFDGDETPRVLLNHTADKPLDMTVATDGAGVQTVTATIPAPKDPDEVVSPHTIVQTVDATTPPVPASAELDSQGLPWDKRIHSSSRAKNADGSWRKMRGVAPALVTGVEAELRAVQAAPAAPVAAVIGVDTANGPDTTVYAEVDTRDGVQTVTIVPPAPEWDAAATYRTGDKVLHNGVETTVSAGVGVPPPPPAATDAIAPPPPPPAAVAGDAPMTFAQMMQRITPHIVSGAISQERVNEVCVSLELPHLAALGARPDLIPAALAALESGVVA